MRSEAPFLLDRFLTAQDLAQGDKSIRTIREPADAS